MKRNALQNRANARALQGVLYATLAPVGWLLIRAATGVDPVVALASDLGLYLYLFIGGAVTLGAAGYIIGAQDQRLFDMTQTDFLTRARNSVYFNMRLKEQHALAKRQGKPLAVLVVDVDYFETVNQSFGRAAGDEALTQIARSIHGVLRQGETLARVGGDRFAVILHRCSPGHARLVGERVCAAVRDCQIDLTKGVVIQATASAGAASTARFPSLNAIGLLDQAHRAVGLAKDAGRDGVWIADPSEGHGGAPMSLHRGDERQDAA
ncbi:MAG: GGDEF domain-containing protein [Planctomycetota bacterium]|jgi:diguanylate cyclase (GGDEF)-like protein